MKRARTETGKVYDAEYRGAKRRVTVPDTHEMVAYSGQIAEVMRDVLRDTLSPHAVAAVVSCLRINRTNNSDVDRQVHWFAEDLCKLLGGHEQQTRLAEELGL